MSLTYFKFLFVNTIKRKPIWITWLLFLFTCVSFIIIVPVMAKMNTLEVWSNATMTICQTFMGMMASLFTAVLAINVFRDTNEEGTELIVVSKPISRFKFVMSKFVVYGAFCLLINLSTVFLTVFTIFLPKTEPKFYWGLLVSMFIGNLVTFGVFGSISILLSVKFAKVGIIITNIIISLVFLVYQTLTLFVFKTPLNVLTDNSVAPLTYMVQNRDVETGKYKEQEIVNFNPSSVSAQHPCQATNWQEMKDFWEKDILSKDVTPLLNATDFASQLALVYMSVGTDEFAHRQANRMFAISRFYNYTLTSPASPEIYDGVEDKQTIQWLYTGFRSFTIPLEQFGLDPIEFYLPESFGFAGIPPLTGTRLRGYTDKIPVGTVKSKEILSSREVLFEPDQWKKYAPAFDAMYKSVFDYRNYDDECGGIPPDIQPYLWPSLFASSNKTIKHYYDIVWSCFTNKAQDYMDPVVYGESKISQYDTTYFDINNVSDLNDRFIQFKNYIYYKILKEQTDVLNNGTTYCDEEKQAYDSIYSNALIKKICDWLGIQYVKGTWLMRANKSDDPNLSILADKTRAPSFNWMALTTDTETLILDAEMAAGLITRDQYNDRLMSCAQAKVLKTEFVFNRVCNEEENYLYSSLDRPNRSSKYSGRAYMNKDTWYPNIHHEFIQQFMQINIPVGQNQTYFFYETKPTLNYWMFTIIWGSISLLLFAAGIVIYNKYDVK